MTTTARTADGGPPPIERLRAGLERLGIPPVWWVLLLICAVALAVIGPRFVSLDNVTGILVRSVSLGLVAAGQTLAILVGSLDLSVAYLVSVAAVLSGVVMQGDPGRIALGVAAVAAIGVLVGATNGLVITKLRVNPFIATLGMALVLRGLLNATFSNFAGSVPREFQGLGYGGLGPLPYSVLLLAAVFAVIWYVLRHTRFGHHLYAVGGDEQVARLSGVRSHRVIIAAHVICSLCAALAGLFLVSRLGSGAPWVGPQGAYDLESIAAVVVGGTALAGGRGGVIGTLAGVFVLAVLDNVFNLLQINAFWKDVLRGIILIVAVAIYVIRTRERNR
jgi:ribose transport system permease protein